MKQTIIASPERHGETNDEINLLDVIIVLSKHKKLIFLLPLIAALFTAAISLTLPDIYKASTKLLPPQQSQSGAAALLSQLGGMAGVATTAAGIKNPSDLYVGMLESRTIADKLVAKFDLKKIYETESQEVARRRLRENTDITSGKDGFITVDFEDEHKQLVAPIANAYAEELFALTRIIAVTEASQRRLFYERELEKAKDNLAVAEANLKTRLDTGGVISVDGQSKALVETIGRLRAQISAKEVQLNSMKSFVTPNNPEYRRVEEELLSLRAELSKLENGRTGTHQNFASEPRQLGLESVKSLRDVKYYGMLYELLAKQYEVARLDEAKDPSTIQVLDPAVEPEKKFKPRRTLIVLLVAFLAGVIAIASAFILEIRHKAKSQLKQRRLDLAQ